MSTASEHLFGARIREFRKERGWSQEELAKRMSEAGYAMHQTTVAKMENASRPTSIGEAAELAFVFHVKVADLLEDSERPAVKEEGTFTNTLGDWAQAMDKMAIEEAEAGRPNRARSYIECAEVFERRQVQIDARDFNEPDPAEVRAVVQLEKIRLGVQPFLDTWPVLIYSREDTRQILQDVYEWAGGES